MSHRSQASINRAINEPNEITEMWRDVHADQRLRRERWREKNTADILALQAEGYAIRQLTDFQFRVNEAIDLYPTNRKYHVLSTQRRGSYRQETALACVRRLGITAVSGYAAATGT